MYFSHFHKKLLRYGLIQCLPEVLATIKTGHSLRETVNARYLPMLVPPRPWTSPQTGGYLAFEKKKV